MKNLVDILEGVLDIDKINKGTDLHALEKMNPMDFDKIIFDQLGCEFNSRDFKTPEKKITMKGPKGSGERGFYPISKPYKGYVYVDGGFICKPGRVPTTVNIVCQVGNRAQASDIYSKMFGYEYYQLDPNNIKEFLDDLKL